MHMLPIHFGFNQFTFLAASFSLGTINKNLLTHYVDFSIEAHSDKTSSEESTPSKDAPKTISESKKILEKKGKWEIYSAEFIDICIR